jgi:hypothetical protein
MEPTTILTDTQSVVLLQLPSGNVGMMVYTVTVGEFVIVILLATLLAFKVLEVWRGRRC